MPKIIETHHAVLVSVESTGVMEESEWCWREAFTGTTGRLTVFESESEPDKKFCLIEGNDQYLRTGRGAISREDDRLVINTKNSVYSFVIIKRKPLRFGGIKESGGVIDV